MLIGVTLLLLLCLCDNYIVPCCIAAQVGVSVGKIPVLSHFLVSFVMLAVLMVIVIVFVVIFH